MLIIPQYRLHRCTIEYLRRRFPSASNRDFVALAVEGHISLLPLHYLTRPPHSYMYDLIVASRDLLQTAYRSRQLHLALLMRLSRPLV